MTASRSTVDVVPPGGRRVDDAAWRYPDAVVDRVARPGSLVHAGLSVVLSLVAAGAAAFVVLFGLGMLVTHIGPVDRWDDRVNAWFVDRRTPALTTVSYWGTYIANTLGVVAVAAVVTVGLLVRRVGRMAALLACGLGLELSVFLATNYTVGRPRPHVAHLGSTPSTYSFPSGHAAATLVLYAGIAVLVFERCRNRAARVAAVIVAVSFPLWVAFSRVYRGQHHVTDVIAGLAMGAVVLGSAVAILRRTESLDDASAPSRAEVAA